MRPCIRCKKDFDPTHPQQQLCAPCQPLRRAEMDKANYEANKDKRNKRAMERRAAERAKFEKPVTATPEAPEKPVIISDEEQRRINRAIDEKHSIRCECKVYKPGDKEFEEIAKQVVPIQFVRKELRTPHIITAARVDTTRHRYAETGI